MLRYCYAFALGVLVTSLQSPVVQLAAAEDWPMLGRDSTRNPASPAKKPPLDWHVGQWNRKTGKWNKETARNIKWASRLGYNTYGDPVVASGLVWIGTTNFDPHGDRRLPDASVLACFRETDGKLLYRYVSPRLSLGREFDWPYSSLACSPWIEDDRIWFTTNRAEVVCLNIAPLKRGQGDPVVVWKLDMIKELGVHRRGADMGLGHTCSIAGYKDLIYVITGNGVSGYSSEVPAPNAPSLICLNKNDGTVVWEDSSPGENILFGQWGSPLVAEIKGRVQVIVPQGDGWVRSFHAQTGEPLWQFDMNLKTSKWKAGGRGNRNNVFATPVLYNERVYVASGMHPGFAEDAGRLCCIDPTKTGDVSPELAVSPNGAALPHRREQAVDPEAGEKAMPNPNSALIWDYTQLDTNGNGEFEWEERLHRTAASVAIKNDLLIAVDFSGFVHCFHATTGKRYWQYDMFAAIHASPLIVDDKVYVADEDGDVAIFNLSADPRKAMKEMGNALHPINSRIVNGEVEVTNMDNSVYTSPIFANGALYIANRSRLFAIRAGDDSGADRNPAASQNMGYWPQWRGPNRDNISTETGLLKEWPAGGPPLEWVVEGLGHGIASVSIAAGRIYTTTYNENIEFVVCLDQRTGNLTWAAPVGLAVPESPLMRWLSQRSVSLDGDRLYTATAQGELICLSTRDGSERWRKNYVNDFRGKRGWWGYCDFPLVDGDKLICTPGGSEATIVALNKRTGDVKWKCPIAIDDQRGGSAGYAATMVAEIDGVRQYINFLHGALVGVSTEGKLLWRYNRFDREQSALTPLLQGNQLFCAGGHGNYGTALLTLVHEGQGWKLREEYFADVRLNHFQDNMIRIGEHVFASNRIGPVCLGIEDGKPVWQAPRRRPRRPFIAMTYADGHVYLRGADDEIALVEATPEAYRVKSSFVLPAPEAAVGATAPVVAGGRLYIRDDDRLFCYDIRQSIHVTPRVDLAPVMVRLPTQPTQVIESDGRRTTRARPRSVFVPTPHDVVEKMLEMASVTRDDLVYDLGSGDGRIVITAAKKHGSRAIGVEIDPELVAVSRERAAKEGVSDLVTIENKDIYELDLGRADVVAVYLLPRQLERLIDQFAALPEGTRVVSHQFEIPGIRARRQIRFRSTEDGALHTIYLWVAPISR